MLSKQATKALENLKSKSLIHRFANILSETPQKHQTTLQHLESFLWLLHQKTNQPPLPLFTQAVELSMPYIQCATYKRGAKNIRVPIPVSRYRGESYVLRWIKQNVQIKKEGERKSLDKRLCDEVLKILEGESSCLKKKGEMQKEALMNRSFAHHAWQVGQFK